MVSHLRSFDAEIPRLVCIVRFGKWPFRTMACKPKKSNSLDIGLVKWKNEVFWVMKYSVALGKYFKEKIFGILKMAEVNPAPKIMIKENFLR